MSIQSLSIVVPGTKCINNCEFCVSRTHKDIVYEDRISEDIKRCTPREREWKYNNYSATNNTEKYNTALRYARDLGCTTVMLTGECEPQQNKSFINWIFHSGRFDLLKLFHNIEIQTTGAGLNKESIHELVQSGVNTFSLSVSSFLDKENNSIIGTSTHNAIHLKELCNIIKEENCLLRLSINLNDTFYHLKEDGILVTAKQVYNADQVTLRSLYKSGKDCPQDKWIERHCDPEKDKEYLEYIRMNGTPLEILPYGNIKYSIAGVGTVVDGDCMAKNNLNDIRYLILRPDCHLYTRWDDPASIIF